MSQDVVAFLVCSLATFYACHGRSASRAKYPHLAWTAAATMSSNKRPTDHLQPSAKKRTQDRQGARDEEEEDSEVIFLHQSCCVWLRAGLRLPQFWALHCNE